jgi:uncharacterized protein DUF1565
VESLSLVVFLGCVSGASGQASSCFDVSTNGNDSNPGSQTEPWRTVQHATDTVGAGGTVKVRGGVYEELVSIKASGNATDGYIIFPSYPGETAVLDAEHFTPSRRQGVLTIHNRATCESKALKFATSAPGSWHFKFR